ncbi:hypothetical protein GGR01_003396 [Acetobacter oeni]|nr:hypothetical protein [Acetobacter oeni]
MTDIDSEQLTRNEWLVAESIKEINTLTLRG